MTENDVNLPQGDTSTRDTGPGMRQLDAEAVNREAQELNDMPADAVIPTAQTQQVEGVDNVPTAEQATEGYKPLAAEENEAQAGVFPPDVDPTIDIGGSPEDREALRQEFRQE